MQRNTLEFRLANPLLALVIGAPIAVALGASSFALSLVVLGIVAGVTTYDTT